VPLLVLIVALDVYCLIDLARAKPVRNVPKWVWVIVILLPAGVRGNRRGERAAPAAAVLRLRAREI